eukprot:CAMPEP_0117677926 /NCGR_PEP_ID=MMETSP0804-20121206/17004_1 /TAXON_ID=1074897 /ORGANISM="Tetraselmis astigmatica, Strain CCMP880" /LENGTH=32 /DNA_ID= /DNA_START= /DNA_END= /DNA_ORIENTATION=
MPAKLQNQKDVKGDILRSTRIWEASRRLFGAE